MRSVMARRQRRGGCGTGCWPRCSRRSSAATPPPTPSAAAKPRRKGAAGGARGGGAGGGGGGGSRCGPCCGRWRLRWQESGKGEKGLRVKKKGRQKGTSPSPLLPSSSNFLSLSAPPVSFSFLSLSSPSPFYPCLLLLSPCPFGPSLLLQNFPSLLLLSANPSFRSCKTEEEKRGGKPVPSTLPFPPLPLSPSPSAPSRSPSPPLISSSFSPPPFLAPSYFLVFKPRVQPQGGGKAQKREGPKEREMVERRNLELIREGRCVRACEMGGG